MNFQHSKDELLKWLVPALVGMVLWRIDVIENKFDAVTTRVDADEKTQTVLQTTQGFIAYRIDQHRDSIQKHTEDIGELKASVKVIQGILK